MSKIVGYILSKCWDEEVCKPTFKAVTSSDTSNKVRVEMLSTMGAILGDMEDGAGCAGAASWEDEEEEKKAITGRGNRILLLRCMSQHPER